MRSVTRLGVRASAAAAGIAAIGLGIAAPAFAAPSLPRLPGTDAASATDLPDAGVFR